LSLRRPTPQTTSRLRRRPTVASAAPLSCLVTPLVARCRPASADWAPADVTSRPSARPPSAALRQPHRGSLDDAAALERASPGW
jgi:hypothetical protein